jgi:D-amino-acid oxidase
MDFPVALSRRQLLRGAGAGLASLALPAQSESAFAACQVLPPVPGRFLTTPDFTRLKRLGFDNKVGDRPHRCGGVKLDYEQPVEVRGEDRYLVHNYGHSGAGITLAWGCAHIVKEWVELLCADIRRAGKRPSVAIFGTGVIGLTVASEIVALRSRIPNLKVTIYARDLELSKTTSIVAGGQFEPSQIWREYHACGRQAELHDIITRSANKIRRLQSQNQAAAHGILNRRNYTFDFRSASGLRVGNEGFEWGVPDSVICRPTYGKLPFQSLNTVDGRRYDTWLINPTILLPKLVRDLRARGVTFVKREVRTRADFFQVNENIIINCIGLGAKAVFDDKLLKPVRGKLVIYKGNPQNLNYFFSGGCGGNPSYLFARQNDVVIGGTVEDNPTDTTDAGWTAISARMERIFNGDVSRCGIRQTPASSTNSRCQPAEPLPTICSRPNTS